MSLSDTEKKLVFILALKLYYDETQESYVAALAASETQNLVNIGNRMAFPTVIDTIGEFIPVSVIGEYTNMRYVWLKNSQKATLARGGVYYSFLNYSNEVIVDNPPDTIEMTRGAKKQGLFYIPDDFAYEKFGTEAQSVPTSPYSVLATDKLWGFAEELFELFLIG